MAKYSAEDVTLSYVEVVRRAELATAKYFQDYYRKQRASRELEKSREKARIAMAHWRSENRDRIVEMRMNRSEEEVSALRKKRREEMRQYREEHKDEIKARETALPPEEKKRRAEMSHLRTKKFRARQKLVNPKPTHIVPDKNMSRNSRRNEQRKHDPHQAKKAMFQMRVSRAKKKLDRTCSGGSPEEVRKATVDLAVAQVERYNFTTSLWIEPDVQPSVCRECKRRSWSEGRWL